MAILAGPNITSPILEYRVYHYNSYTAAAYNIVQAANKHSISWEIPGKVPKTQKLNCLH